MPSRNYILLLIILCVILCAVLFQGPSPSFDDVNYILYAKQMLNGTFSPLQSPYAYGFLLPATIALSYRIFGVNNLAATLPAILEYIILVVLTYLIILKYLENEEIAFLGSASLAFSAFVVLYATRPLPDMFIGVLVAAALYLSIDAEKHIETYLIMGLALGDIIFIKFGGLITVLAMLISLLILDKKKGALLFALGLIAIIIPYFLGIGTLSVISNYSANQVKLSHASLEVNYYMAAYVLNFNYNTKSLLFVQSFPLGLLLLYAFLGTFLILYKRYKNGYFIVLLFWISYLYLFFGTEGIKSYTFIVIVSRYFIWIAAPMALLSAFFLYWVYANLYGKGLRNLAIAAVILLVLLLLISNLPMLIFFKTHMINYQIR